MILVVNLEEIFPNIYNKLNSFTTSRIDIYKVAVQEMKSPLVFLFGKGIGSDRVLLNASFFHSWFFQIIVTRGIFSLLGVTIMLYFIFEILYYSKKDFKYFLAIGIIIYLAYGLTDSAFEYQHIGAIHYLMISMLEKSNLTKNRLLLAQSF